MQLQIGRRVKKIKDKDLSEIMILIQLMQQTKRVYKHVITTSQCFGEEGVFFFNGSMDVSESSSLVLWRGMYD